LISHTHRCVFIHIPKTAGMSIEQAFLNSLNLQFSNGQADELLLSYNNDPDKGPPSLAHLSPTEYIELDYLSTKTYQDYFSFTFVRDPWRRAISLYKHFSFHRIMSFYSFLKYELPLLKKQRYYFVKPQVEYILDKNGKEIVDFIGRFELLNKDFDHIKSLLDYPVSDLQYLNRSSVTGNVYSRWNLIYIIKSLSERPARILWLNLWTRKRLQSGKVYSKRCKKLVGEFYQKDIEYLKYPFPEELSK